MSKQRFLNQKLGKRMSRKTDLQRAKILVTPKRPPQAPRKGWGNNFSKCESA